MPKIGQNEYLSVAQVAQRLGVSTSAVRNYTTAGILRAVRNPLNRYRLYRESDINKLLQKMRMAEVEANL